MSAGKPGGVGHAAGSGAAGSAAAGSGAAASGAGPAQAALARWRLGRGRRAARDAALLAQGGSLEGAALRAAGAALEGAQALLAARGLDRTDPAASVLAFDRALVLPGHVTRASGEAAHRALRALVELTEAPGAGLYAARLSALREGADLLLAEAEIILERELPPESVAAAAEAADEDEP